MPKYQCNLAGSHSGAASRILTWLSHERTPYAATGSPSYSELPTLREPTNVCLEGSSNVISNLESLEAASRPTAVSNSFIEVRKNAFETVVSGNRDGLIQLALQILRLAESESLGAHYSLDETSIADAADTNVVFALKQAPWGSHSIWRT